MPDLRLYSTICPFRISPPTSKADYGASSEMKEMIGLGNLIVIIPSYNQDDTLQRYFSNNAEHKISHRSTYLPFEIISIFVLDNAITPKIMAQCTFRKVNLMFLIPWGLQGS